MSEMKEHMSDFEKLNNLSQPYENNTTNSGLDELTDIKSESSVDIDREQFKDLAKFAEQRKIEEIEQEKGVIRSVLTTKNVEQYTMRKLDSLVKEAALNESPLRKSRTSIQSTAIDTSYWSISTASQRSSVNQLNNKQQDNKSKAREKFDRIFPANEHHPTRRYSLSNLNAFQMNSGSHTNSRSSSNSSSSGNNTITSPAQNGQHRQSSATKMQSQRQQLRHRRNSLHKDVKIKDVIDFFRYLKSNYTNKFTKINSIYKSLHYDVIEATVYQHNPDRDLKEFVFPRSFGPWGQLWEDKQQILKEGSPYKILESYRLRPFMVKGGDDLRQELLAMNMIQKFQDIFKKAGIPVFLRPYEIIVTSESSGFIEFLPNTLSIDALKKSVPNFKNLNDFYKRTFEDYFEEAQKNFIESLAGYSFLCFILQIKDRHNGNILIDNVGHIIHIDFGFILSIAPGGINFEKAHFKLTNEYMMLMGGKESEQFGYFKSLLVRTFIEAKKHVDAICNLVEIMQNNSTLPCFEKFDMIQFRGRFKENNTDKEFMDYVEELIRRSMNRWSTYQYDKFQQITNGILP